MMKSKTKKNNPISKKNNPIFSISADILCEIIDTIGTRPAESGGAIGGMDNDIITHFEFDKSGTTSAVTYTPNDQYLNQLFKEQWNPQDIRFKGFIHSHPGYMRQPSSGDEVYAKRILDHIEDLDQIWLPIVSTIPDTGEFSMTSWVVSPYMQGVEVHKGTIKVVATPDTSKTVLDKLKDIQLNTVLTEIVIPSNKSNFIKNTCKSFKNMIKPSHKDQDKTKTVMPAHVTPLQNEQDKTQTDMSQTFDRVQSAYDLKIMSTSRIIAVGTGGAASWLEELARAGVGQFVLIDPDTVSETNLATQQTYRRDIGRPKVDCIAERIQDINPNVKIVALQKSLDDIDDTAFSDLIKQNIGGDVPSKTIICGLTDNFYAQARVNKLALQFGIPSLNAQVYQEGYGAEITFTYPGVTPACHRCILSSRYKYFLEEQHQNPVTSHGTPIFATTRLTAIKGFITLALLHHGTSHPRWGKMLEGMANRNLVQVRMAPDLADILKIRTFDRVFKAADQERLFFDETVWLPQKQECPDTGYKVCCPDCGGTGDLKDSVGKCSDTRDIQKIQKVHNTQNVPIVNTSKFLN